MLDQDCTGGGSAAGAREFCCDASSCRSHSTNGRQPHCACCSCMNCGRTRGRSAINDLEVAQCGQLEEQCSQIEEETRSSGGICCGEVAAGGERGPRHSRRTLPSLSTSLQKWFIPHLKHSTVRRSVVGVTVRLSGRLGCGWERAAEWDFAENSFDCAGSK